MKKREFKVGDEVFVKGRITFNGPYYTYLDLKLTDKDIFCAYYVALNTDDNMVPASDIKPVKKDEVVYEYQYLRQRFELVKGGSTVPYWDIDTNEYFVSKKEFRLKYGSTTECQRITATKRVRK